MIHLPLIPRHVLAGFRPDPKPLLIEGTTRRVDCGTARPVQVAKALRIVMAGFAIPPVVAWIWRLM